MTKKFFLVIFIMVFTVNLVSFASEEQNPSGNCGDDLCWIIQSNTLYITGTGEMNNYSSSDSAPWGTYSDRVKNVNIGNGITSIGNYAFYRLTKLESISMDTSIVSIGKFAFYGCSSLDLRLPVTVQTIGGSALEKVNQIRYEGTREQWYSLNYDAPVGVICIDGEAYRKGTCGYCVEWELNYDGAIVFSGYGSIPGYSNASWYEYKDKVKNVHINNGIYQISPYAFFDCENITSIYIPSSVTSIGQYSFYNCASIERVDIESVDAWINIEFGEGLQYFTPLYYGGEIYEDGEIIKNIVVYEECKTIRTGTFYGWRSLETVILPDSVTEIGIYAFRKCTGLKTVYIPDSVKTIGNGAFGECTSLEIISLPESVTSLGSTFEGCTSLHKIEIPDSITSLPSYLFHGCIQLSEVTLPEGLFEIGEGAFRGCNSLKTITIPESIKKIGNEVFCGSNNGYTISSSLEDIYFKGDAPDFMDNTFCTVTASAHYPYDNDTWTTDVFQNYGGTITWLPWDPTDIQLYDHTLTLPENTTSIESEAFAGLTQGVNIVIPSTVTFIADDAFAGSDVIVIGEEGGYVEQYCDEKGIMFVGE